MQAIRKNVGEKSKFEKTSSFLTTRFLLYILYIDVIYAISYISYVYGYIS